jgi:hypothetical protein
MIPLQIKRTPKIFGQYDRSHYGRGDITVSVFKVIEEDYTNKIAPELVENIVERLRSVSLF